MVHSKKAPNAFSVLNREELIISTVTQVEENRLKLKRATVRNKFLLLKCQV